MRQIVFSLLILFAIISSATAGDQLLVHFIDVGQGDAILIQTPGGKTMLIDAGEDNKLAEEYLDLKNVKTIDCIVATHPHLDHIGGLVGIMKKYEVKSVVMPRVTDVTTLTYQKLLAAIRDKGLHVIEGRAGVVIDLDPAITAEVLAPNGTGYEDLNDYSVVIKMTYGYVSFLFTGDTTNISEAEMLQNYPSKLKATVLKVPHHGSTSSSSPAFIKAVNPSIAVFQLGRDNEYGHPTQTVLERLAGSQIFRTDEKGSIVLALDAPPAVLPEDQPAQKRWGSYFPDAPARSVTTRETKSDPARTAPSASPRTSVTGTVYVTNTGSKYHTPGCRYLDQSAHVISRDEAMRQYAPCSVCKP